MFAARTLIRRAPVTAPLTRRLTAQEIAANTSNPAGESTFATAFPMMRLAAVPIIGFAMNLAWPQERKVSEKWFC